MKIKIFKLLVYAFAVFGVISFYQKCSTFAKIDACLDHSGAWDYQHERCERINRE